MHSYIRPNTYVALRLPSGVLKPQEIQPNTTISLGKFGSFSANLLLGRPYNLTYEIDDTQKDDKGKPVTKLRIVPVKELNDAAVASSASASESREDEDKVDKADGGVASFDIVGEDGQTIVKNNQLTIDDASRQKLTYDEIEELKKAGTATGKDIIAKIMASHMNLDEKTKFSLYKYTIRKSQKYLKRFTVLPMDVGMLSETLLDREASRIRELREETIGLIGSWANVHYSASSRIVKSLDGKGMIGGGRWLVVDDTGGLLLAAMAERMGILYDDSEDDSEDESNTAQHPATNEDDAAEADVQPMDIDTDPSKPQTNGDGQIPSEPQPNGDSNPPPTPSKKKSNRPSRSHHLQSLNMSGTTNTLTLLHTSTQPNTGLLKFFGYDTSSPSTFHPLYTHLKSLSWAQLLSPETDAGYIEPEICTPETIASWKAAKRGTYYRKRRRWERVRRVVDETRAGGFDGLVVAAQIDPSDILSHTVHLLRGGAQVVVYSPTIEPLTTLMDFCSKERKTAYMNLPDGEIPDPIEFPFNPTMLLGSMLQTARARHWQVLPGRTHPVMTSRGLAEGYVFTATRVLPVEGKVEARGVFTRKKKVVETVAPEPQDVKGGVEGPSEVKVGVNGNVKKRAAGDAVEEGQEVKKSKSDVDVDGGQGGS